MILVPCFILFLGVLAVPYEPQCKGTLIDVRDFGAVGDGKTLNRDSFNRAFRSLKNGGCVGVFNGHYLVSQIDLLSNTFLYIHNDATVLGSVDQNDYIWNPQLGWPQNWVTLRAIGVKNVGLIGQGVLDGQAMKMIDHYDPVQNQLIPKMWTGPPHNCQQECRPRNVVFINTTTIYLHGVTIKDSPDWTNHYLGCRDILVEHVTVYGDERWPNNDGIDPDSSQDIVIRHSHVSTGDDGICPKTTRGYGPLRNMTVYNTTIRSRSAAIKFGSATPEDFFDILFENITIGQSHRGIGFQIRDEGSVYNVTFRNINIDFAQFYPQTWWGSGESIWITANQRVPGRKCGTAHDIFFHNITGRSENGIVVSSFHGNQPFIHHLYFHQISLTIGKFGNYTQPTLDYRPSYKPDTLDGPINGFYFEYAEGITVTDSKMRFLKNATNVGECHKKGPGAHDLRLEITCL